MTIGFGPRNSLLAADEQMALFAGVSAIDGADAMLQSSA